MRRLFELQPDEEGERFREVLGFIAQVSAARLLSCPSRRTFPSLAGPSIPLASGFGSCRQRTHSSLFPIESRAHPPNLCLVSLRVTRRQVSQCYPKETKEFPGQLSTLLLDHHATLSPETRKSIVQNLVMLRNKDVIPSIESVPTSPVCWSLSIGPVSPFGVVRGRPRANRKADQNLSSPCHTRPLLAIISSIALLFAPLPHEMDLVFAHPSLLLDRLLRTLFPLLPILTSAPLRSSIRKTILTDIRTANAKTKNHKLNRMVQALLFGMVERGMGGDVEGSRVKGKGKKHEDQDAKGGEAMWAVVLVKELWRKGIW